ncbi:hypothetical protein [Modicisalibacter sp. MOD 31.J]|uniref:hypothetical protein n=1 Tax=Modicisalibacter sp. MOD 31.J TaxID=2831897 RepID=UPI001CCAFBCD|nr:hypothetical protein [Modicisalibacter sp. MOD 31.J]
MSFFLHRGIETPSLPLPPSGDRAFAPLLDARMRWPVRRARWQAALRDGFQRRVGIPIEEFWWHLWERHLPGGDRLEGLGLPRRSLESRLGERLVVHVDPRELVRSVDWRGTGRHRPSSSAFVWDGDWDLRRGDLRHSSRYRFISDIDAHRHDLRLTERFRQLHARLESGRPWSSYQQGILLDSDERILTYLRVYLSFLDDMTLRGFDATRGKDVLGVAVTREGRLLKINRGLHRLAMAQRLGLPSIPVQVKSVHRQWWDAVVAGARGSQALERLAEALPGCTPEWRPGPLDPAPDLGEVAWPEPRHTLS